MRQIDLEEYEPSRPVRLPTSERDALLHESRTLDLSITPCPGDANRYILKPGSTVGAVEIGDLSVLIRPKIPIPHLLSLGVLRHEQIQTPAGKCSTSQINTRCRRAGPRSRIDRATGFRARDCSTATVPRKRRSTPCADASCSPSRYGKGLASPLPVRGALRRIHGRHFGKPAGGKRLRPGSAECDCALETPAPDWDGLRRC